MDKKVYAIKKNETDEIRITLREYKGEQYVDIRLFFQPKDEEEMRPRKKGVMLTLFQFSALRKGLDQVKDFIPETQKSGKE